MALKPSQEEMMEHSKAKIKLLELYIQQYLEVLDKNRYVENIYVFDLFCGPGLYGDAEGSPIIILKTIKNIYFRNKSQNKPFTPMHCRFSDKDKMKIEALEKNISDKKLHYPYLGSLELFNTPYHLMHPFVVDSIEKAKKSKAFVFIDPYGYSIKLEEISQLLESGNSEVLLWLPTQMMYRFENKATPGSLEDLLNGLSKEGWGSSKSGVDFIDRFSDALYNHFEGRYFVDSFILARSKNQYFALFFFTSHIYGFDRMLHAKWKLDEEEGRGFKYTPPSQTVDLFSQLQTDSTHKLEEALKEYLKKERTSGDIYEFTLRKRYLPKHTNKIIANFEDKGLIDFTRHDGNNHRKKSYYINHDTYREEQQGTLKLTIKLK